MTKGRNSSSDTPKPDFGLPKTKILRGQKNFQRLFESTATVLRTDSVSLRFQLVDDPDKGEVKMAFIVPRKLGKAVKRNRVKRLLKEAYRVNHQLIADAVAGRTAALHGALMAGTLDLDAAEAEQQVVDLLTQARAHLPSITGTDS